MEHGRKRLDTCQLCPLSLFDFDELGHVVWNSDCNFALSLVCVQPGLRPVNRLRSSSSQLCSRCASVISYNNSRMTSRATSQMSLFQMSVNFRKMSSSAAMFDPETPQCKICLMDTPLREMAKLQECGCTFCKEVRCYDYVMSLSIVANIASFVFQCMLQYLTFEVMAGAYDISCPDPACDKQGVLQLTEIENMAGKDVADKHKAFRLNTGKILHITK